MRSYETYKQKVLEEEPGVKEAYDSLQPEFDIIQAIIDAMHISAVFPKVQKR